MNSVRVVFRLVLATAIGVSCVLSNPRLAAAQPLPILVGVAGGAAAGGWTTVATFIARARTGSFVFDADDVAQIRIETLPVLLFPLVGGLIGARSTDRLKAVGAGAGLGAVGGAVLGIGVGAWVGDTPEALWAGGIIGSALGMLVGGAIGGTRSTSDGGPPSPGSGGGSFSISIPLGGG
jgi:hypothetical protein